MTIENILDGRLVLPPRFVSLDNSSEVTGIGTALTALHGISSIPVLPAMLLAQNITSGQTSSMPDHNTHRILQYSLPLVPAQPDHYQSNAVPPNNEATSSHSERYIFRLFYIMIYIIFLVIIYIYLCFSDEHVPIRGRFSKCSHERERILQKRKEQLLHSARKRFIEKQLKKAYNQTERSDEASTSEKSPINSIPNDSTT